MLRCFAIDSHMPSEVVPLCGHKGCINDGWFIVLTEDVDDNGMAIVQFICIVHLEEAQREE